MRKVLLKRLLGIGTVMAMTATGVFGQMNSITALAEESASASDLNGEIRENAVEKDGESSEAKDKAEIEKEEVAEGESGANEENKEVKTESEEKKSGSGEEKPEDGGNETGGSADNGAGTEDEKPEAQEQEIEDEKSEPEAENNEEEKEEVKDEETENKGEEPELMAKGTNEEKEEAVIKSVTVNTEVKKLGQYPVSMVVTFEDALAEDLELTADDFTISANKSGWLANGITERDIEVGVTSVSLSDDRTSVTIVPDTFPDRYYYVPEYTVTCTLDGNEYFSFNREDVTKTVTPVADDFSYVSDGGFSYNIYEPQADEAVPVVVVFHGFGDDENLYANRTAVEWAEADNQADRPAYVIAPQFGGYAYVSEAARMNVYAKTKSVIDELISEGKADPERIYITGKSFGGAAVLEFNETYPDYSAASIAMAPAVAYTDYFGNVTKSENLEKIKDKSIWIAQCEADSTAPYQGTVSAYETLETLGADNILFTTYSKDELDASGANGDYHAVECIVMDESRYPQWLFSKVRNNVSKSNLDYSVILPEGYSTSGAAYPVVYVMPNDGLSEFSETALLQLKNTLSESAMDMIIVKVSFEEGDDPYSEVQDIIAEVDSRYVTLGEASFRAVIGEEVGGYLAHALTYTDGQKNFRSTPELFGLMASINGDYAGESNTWLEKYGDMLGLSRLNNSTALKFYTYLSAATEDPRAYAENGANSVIKYFIKNASAYGGFYAAYFGNADGYSQNFSIKNGVFDETFEKKSVAEAAAGFNRRITQNLVTGSLTLSPQSALESLEEIEASYSITVSDKYNKFFGSKNSNMVAEIVMTDPDSSEVLERVSVGEFTVGAGTVTGTVMIPNTVKNVSTSVALVVSLQGTDFAVDAQDLVRVLGTGTSPEDQLIDFMGVWKVKAIANSSFAKEDWVGADGKLELGDFGSWADATPCITWWNGTNGVERNFVGYAWYVREFDIPADFTVGTYQMPIGYLDEGDVTFINGVQIGQTGMDPDTWKMESDQWDTYRSYEVSPEILNFGGKNYVAVLAHNNSGDGGWYKGHPGLYSQAAYNRLNSAPSTLAPEDAQTLVKRAIDTQIKAVAKGDLKMFADTVSADYFQSGINKEKLLETVKSYGKGTVVDTEGTVFEAGDNLYLYQARRTITTEGGDKLSLEVNEYFTVEGKKAYLYGEHDRFYTQYIDSKNRALALGSGSDTEKESFLVYLPEGYFAKENADKRYPVAYIFHQINSSSNSWKIDGINEFLDSGIAAGLIKNTILVIPDSVPTSWWQGSWVDMVTEDIIPFVDDNYRTVQDARFRFTVGASMGGSGSYNIGLRNPNLFSGIISYFGAINMGANPLALAQDQYKKGYIDYLKYYGQYFVCGNQDLYKFGIPAIELDALLRNVKIDHYFELEEGAHDSTFYKPYVVDSFSYMTSRIPSVSAQEAASVLEVSASGAKLSDGKVTANVKVNVNGAVSDYLTTVPESDFTKDTNPDLVVPVTARLVNSDGVTVARKTVYINVDSQVSTSCDFELESYDIVKSRDYTLVASANLLDYPSVAAVSLKGKKPAVVPTPSGENNISSGDETPASEAMAEAEESGEGSGSGSATGNSTAAGNTAGAAGTTVANAAVASANQGAAVATAAPTATNRASAAGRSGAGNQTGNNASASGQDGAGEAQAEGSEDSVGTVTGDQASAETIAQENEPVKLTDGEEVQETETEGTKVIEDEAAAKAAAPVNGKMSTGSVAALVIALAALALGAIFFGIRFLNRK